MTARLHAKSFDELTPAELYRLLQLRVDVFVVEQSCAYRELDGRDREPTTRHLWLDDGDDLLACLRLLDDGRELRIGRVVTAPDHRGRGHGERLISSALDLCGTADVVLDAQSHLTDWYARLGFVPDGAEFIEDGIPHTPMRRAAP